MTNDVRQDSQELPLKSAPEYVAPTPTETEYRAAEGAESAACPVEPHPARPGWLIFCPHRMVDRVTEVTVSDLIGRGIRGVILDLDNTLVLWHQEEMTEEVVAWLEGLKAAGLKLCILSNSVLSRRSERIANRLNCSFVRQAGKPGKRGFHRSMAAMGTHPSTTAIVGDQMFTDILGGNRVGIYTIMVRPIHKKEFPYTRYVSRPPERLLLRWFKRKGHL
ncbi:MAG TPA: YqeG family HAD IIIA-type phosphatase [Chthonomonadaceae bacterium]|nr:YqeG family HAD IIIA-type phosphatase [Chthonomonadaceae bacterium]